MTYFPQRRRAPALLLALLFTLAACTGGGIDSAAAPAPGLDSDGDGIPDAFEILIGSDPANPMSPLPTGMMGNDVNDATGPAGDGISDALEDVLIAGGASAPVTTGTDTDGDGIPDATEVFAGTDPFDANDPVLDGDADLIDGTGPADFIPDGLEQFLIDGGAIAPVTPMTDSDGDGIPDYLEVVAGSDPFDANSPSASPLTDTDGDGIADGLEDALVNAGAAAPITPLSDTDGDGAPDWFEVFVGTNPLDGDHPVATGGADLIDASGPAGDGVSDALETALVLGGAIPPITLTTDTDGDGIPDVLEVRSGTDPFDGDAPITMGGADTDGDGISDALEDFLVAGGATAPVTPATDTDNDGSPDWFEVAQGSDAFDGDSPVNTGANDTDDATGPAGDGISDALERNLIDGGATAPVTAMTDTDGDGTPDYYEVRTGSDPFDANSPVSAGGNDVVDATGPAGDGISDALEASLISEGAMAPVTATTDSDGDGVPDYFEVRSGSDPFDATSPLASGALANDTDDTTGPAGDGVSDALEIALINQGASVPVTEASDSDGDGISDVLEVRTGSDPFSADDPTANGGADADDATGPSGDGISDALEQFLIDQGATGPITTLTDSDGDGVPDYLEIAGGTNPFDLNDPTPGGDADTDGDGISDALEDALVAGGAMAPVTVMTDTDGDGIPDWYEVFRGTNPFDGDDPLLAGGNDVIDATGPAGDSISDALEQILSDGGAVAPVTTLTDSDGDGSPDYFEVRSGTDPFDVNDPVTGSNAADVDPATGPGSDGISDALEANLIAQGAVAPITPQTDTDGDGIPDYAEVATGDDPFDADSPLVGGGAGNDVNDATGPGGDGISDALEQWLIDQGAMAPITVDTETDGDAIADLVEVFTGTDPFDPTDNVAGQLGDADADGAPDYLEFLAGSDPYDVDSPVLAGGLDTNDATGPVDIISDALEQTLITLGTASPVTTLSDSDGDIAPDWAEVRAGFDPYDLNSPVVLGNLDIVDATGLPDGISDALEALVIAFGAAAPVSGQTDTDGDLIPDHAEIAFGFDNLDGDNPVTNGGQDSDGDGVSDALEFALASFGTPAPVTPFSDTDGDGAPDYLEVYASANPFDINNPFPAGAGDGDADGISDGLEVTLFLLGSPSPVEPGNDLDMDGVTDIAEVLAGTNPFDPLSF